MEKISEDIAHKEFNRWFESKKLGSSYKGETYEPIERQLIDAIIDGYLIVNEDCTLTLKLAWPLSNPTELTELKFVHRIQVNELQTKTAWAKDNREKKLVATVAALTGQVGGLIGALDPVDFSRAGAIASYFF